MKRPISLLIDQLHLLSNSHLFPPRSADGSLVGKSGEWYEPYCKNWLFEDVHPCGRLRKRTVLLYMLSGTKPPSLLKNSIAELRGTEKYRKSHLHYAISRQFGSERWHFVFFKTHQFSFSTGWV